MNHLDREFKPRIDIQQATEETKANNAFLDMSDADLQAYIKEHFPEITPAVWHQLEALNQHSIERVIALHNPLVSDTDKNDILTKTHLSYELNMARIVLAHAKDIEAFLFATNPEPISFGAVTITREEVIQKLVYMIIISDVGKAGPSPVSDTKENPILSIYTNVILTPETHGQWLKQQTPATFPPELTTAVATVTSNPELEKQVFGAGNFAMAPIRLALYCGQQAFAQNYPDFTQYLPLFEWDEKKEAAIRSLGFDPDVTPMKDFYTKAHLLCGEEFFKSDAIPPHLRHIAQLALLHHFAQNVGPRNLDGITFEDPRAIQLIALTEILDKSDAIANRAQQVTPQVHSLLTRNSVMPRILEKNNQDTENGEVKNYNETLVFLESNGMLTALLRSQH